ncbi:DEKNAAC103853 [Brettanomyces naardenensis]|uniref:U3 small nucleolar RNA-associated protein 11 n=1 Tax=Brettanomyces naardenensis TaxID=13370 RepID=A0A448YPC2_BRENA|nr:DEKNAAC103853 [Brettanomyces naardenensis]
MAGFVHDVQKKQHRERSQPQRRKRLGFLEKKKDYRLRAADYHKKQAQLKILKQKAKAYNEDEYYHAMTRKETDARGILIADRGNETLSNEEVLLLKTQDTGYLNTIAQRDSRRIEKDLNESSTFKSSGNHTIFVESKEEMDSFDAAKHFDTDPSLLYKRENRLRVGQLSGRNEKDGTINDVSIIGSLEDGEVAKRDEEKLKTLTILEQRIERQKKLRGLHKKLELQKELMKGGDMKKVETKEGRTVFKWRNQRKR